MKDSKITVMLISLFFISFAHAEATGWKQSEVTQGFMEGLTKDQCVEKTVASLMVDNPSEDYLETLAGISGDCVTWAKGSEEQFCKTYVEKYVRGFCSVNAMDARDCVLVHVMHQSSCFTKKY